MGGNLELLKVKTPRQKMPHIRGVILTIPITILHRYKEVKIYGYIMFINGIHFIINISRHLKFMTSEHIDKAEAKKLQEYIRQVKQFYMQRASR